MPFGLKNVGATYQRLVDKAFQKQIGRNLKVYVDDLVIKSRTEQEIMRDIEETFKTLTEINMKLNPKKYTFGIEEGMFLGYKVNTKGIKVCPDKVEAVLSLPSLKCLKDVQKFNGKLASLNRFLAKSAEKSLPFFKTLKKCTKKSDFQWTAKDEVAFKQMKKLIAELPTLTAPMEKEELIVYLAAAREAYRPRTSVKGQILADFIVERLEDDPLDTPMEAEEELPDLWTLFTDGSSCVDGSGAVANQVNESYIAKDPGMIQYLEKVKTLSGSFKKFSIKHVSRSENKKVDALSKITSTSFAHLTKQILVKELNEKSINEAEVLAVVEEEGDTWMTPIYNYLTEETLPAEKEKARALRRKSGRYTVINGVLYKKSYLGPYKGHTDRILLANNARECKKIDKGMSRLPGSLPRAKKPAAKTDSHHVPVAILQIGIDIAEPFPEGPGKIKFLIVAMDYFTKWIEAKPVATITVLCFRQVSTGQWLSRKSKQKLRRMNKGAA
ncbi:reverse transcriptase domain-containing protein [Tanacetum coccineum]|uniref:Reverse transcriptase domain-containing protein n=1 Tax=Tanacetum coccineum TaxID=301880 RepID=A0ABQ4ZCX0_9ASTR